MAKILTIILNWRTAEMTLKAAEAALQAMQGIEGALTIVDNHSEDGSFELMAAQVKARGWDVGAQQVRVLQAGRNGGFGAGNNHGIRAGMPDGGRPDYVYILNSDAFPEPKAITFLVEFLEVHPRYAMAGSFIQGVDGVPHHTAFRFPTMLGELEQAAKFGPLSRLLRRYVIAPPLPQNTEKVDWVAGASVLIRQSALDEIDLFDEAFFLYYEETELCHRAAAAGWSTAYVRESRVTHIGSVSTGMKKWNRIPQFWLDSRLYYFSKTKGRLYASFATGACLLGGLLWRARVLLQRQDINDPKYFLKDMLAHWGRNACGIRPPKGGLR